MFYPVDNTVEMFDVKNRFVSLIHSIQYKLYNIHYTSKVCFIKPRFPDKM